MKKILFIIAICFCFFGCSTKSEFKTSYDKAEYGFANFIYLGEVRGDLAGNVYVDTNTNVLYIANHNGRLSPIMKSDGSCLTFREWREKNGFVENPFFDYDVFPGNKKEKVLDRMGLDDILSAMVEGRPTPHDFVKSYNKDGSAHWYCKKCDITVDYDGGGYTINTVDIARDFLECRGKE